MTGVGRLLDIIGRFPQVRPVVLGDVMLDEYVYGTVDRVSPEAPVPVLAVQRAESMLGGAGNVARNVAGLGGSCVLASLVGTDEAGATLQAAVDAEERIGNALRASPARTTTRKSRFVCGPQQLVRVDRERYLPASDAERCQLVALLADELPRSSMLVISDYAKGVVTDELVRDAIGTARSAGKPVVADPKGDRFERYAGATILKPNARELAAATGLPAGDDGEVERAAGALLRRVDVETIVVTRSARGVTVVPRGGAPVHLRAAPREVFDVSGAGDTALACLALALGAGASTVEAATLANAAAGVAVSKVGTAVVRRDELARDLGERGARRAEQKVVTREAAAEAARRWAAEGRVVGFTNGCFDLLHPGHVALLEFAKEACDRLVVGLNADASVRRLKGSRRPINPESARALMLACLEVVDAVVVFGEDTPLSLIGELRPQVLVKGADYEVDAIVGAGLVQSYGGKVLRAPLLPGHSTTGLVQSLQK